MGCNKPATNWKSDKREEMALDWTYFEKRRGRYREGGIGLESTRMHGDEVVQEKPGRRRLKKKLQRWERPGRK
jgi:hypothetical protein